MGSLTVAQWNQNIFARGGTETDRAALLDDHGVGVLFAQELNEYRYRALAEALGDRWWGLSATSVDGAELSSRASRVAVFGRSEIVQLDPGRGPQVIEHPTTESADLFRGRSLAVPATTDSGPVTLASVHVRPAADPAIRSKKLAFVTDAGEWLSGLPHPVVAGVDSNSPGREGEDAYWSVEQDVWGPAAVHGLLDVWRDFDATRVGESHTHVLKGPDPGYVRFDHLYVSPEIAVQRVRHIWEEAQAVGTDHALVVADLVLPDH